MTDDVQRTKREARERIDHVAADLVRLSHDIHANPELMFEEVLAAGWASGLLEDQGFTVERGQAGLDTAFVATYGSGELVLTLCAEFDALPEMGHACGHNLICGSSVGAGLGLAAVADELGLTVQVVGTPAEEGGGGKALLLDAGVFDDTHAALMAHPGPAGADLVDWAPVVVALASLEITYTGRAAHAAGNRHEGINAADAATVAQVAIGLLRQQLRATELIHGYVHHGGDAPQIIPDRTTLRYLIRSETLEQVAELETRVRRCFEAGALATGCEVEIRHTAPAYSHIEADRELTQRYAENARSLGRTPIGLPAGQRVGFASTDMANLTLAMPAIHPGFGVPGATVAPHHADFAHACATPDADDSMLFAATALAWTAIDAASDEETRARLLRRERVV